MAANPPCTIFLIRHAARVAPPAAGLNRCFYRSPVDALVHLIVWRGLRRPIPAGYPIWLAVSTLAHLCVTVIPPGRPACRGYMWGLRICPDVFEYLPDVGTVRDKRNQAHLPTTKRAHQRVNLIDAGEQHRPQVLCRRALGQHRLALGWQRAAQRRRTRRALSRVGRRALHHGGLRRCRQSRHRSPERRIRCQLGTLNQAQSALTGTTLMLISRMCCSVCSPTKTT